MIVFVGGMQRSGSTFSFNVARELLRSRGIVHQEASLDILGELRRAGPADHVLLKAHELDDTGIARARYGAMRVICTVRRPADAVASWMQTFGFSEVDAINHLRTWLRMYQQIRSVALTVPYDLIDRRPVRAARLIARFLCPAAGWCETWHIGNRYAKARTKALADDLAGHAGLIDIGFSQYDPATFFHRRHVSGMQSIPAERRLSPERARRIQDALQDAVMDAGLYRQTGKDGE